MSTLSIEPFKAVLVGKSSLSAAGITTGYFQIIDTNVHSYQTDPSYIALVKLGNAYPAIRAYSVFIFNNENQPLTVSFIANVVNNGSFPDVTLNLPNGSTSITVNAGSTAIVSFSFNSYPVEYFSVQLQYSTAPTAASNSALPYGVFGMLFSYVGE